MYLFKPGLLENFKNALLKQRSDSLKWESAEKVANNLYFTYRKQSWAASVWKNKLNKFRMDWWSANLNVVKRKGNAATLNHLIFQKLYN